MINAKYIMPLAILSMILAVVLVLALGRTVPGEETGVTDQTNQAEYVTQIFNKDRITEISIKINQEDWDWLMENAMEEEYRSCDITINGTTYYHVGIRPKGNSSLNTVAKDDTSDRFSFKLSFDEYVDGQTCYGLEKLALNNIISDSTYMKEYLSYEMFDFMDIATPAYAYTNITINDNPWGLYLAVEVMEESFLQRSYGSTEGNLYKPESMDMGGGNGAGAGGQPPNAGENIPVENQQQAGPSAPDQAEAENDANEVQRSFPQRPEQGAGPGGGSGGRGGTNLVYNGDDTANYSGIFDNTILKSTDEEDWQKVIEMIKNLNTGTNLEEYMDVDQVLRYFAVNTFLVNLDSYAGNMKHNYYLYEEEGVFQILPWDFNLSFGGFGMDSAEKVINFPIDAPVTDTMENSPLIAKLLEVPKYQELYHQYLDQLVKNYVESGIYQATINKLDALISPSVKNDATAFYTYEEYQNSLPHLVQLGIDRAVGITAQLAGEQPSDTYGTLATSVDLKALGSMGGGAGGGPVGGRPDETENNNRDTPDRRNNMEQNNGNFTGSNIPEGGMRTPGQNSGVQQGTKPDIMMIAVSMVFLLAALVFVHRFQRKKRGL